MGTIVCARCGQPCGCNIFEIAGKDYCLGCATADAVKPMVFLDDLPEVRGWPEKQRAFVSVALRLFGESMRSVHEGRLSVAADRRQEARAASVSLRRVQRQYATRAAERERDRGLSATAFKRF